MSDSEHSASKHPAPRAVIFDADGVLILAPQLFSRVYASQRGLDPQALEPFFGQDFKRALVGEADLKDLLSTSPLWNWEGDPQDLIDEWFASENHPNHDLIVLIRGLREAGVPVFLATNQERYRADYLRNVMFPGLFDELFISCELGCTKSGDEYWRILLDRVGKLVPGIKPSEIIYFDDSQSHLTPALRAGIDAHLYRNPEQVNDLLSPVVHLTHKHK